jgi:hypothetical protein
MVLIVAGKDTVAQRCKAAGVSGKTNLTEVNNTCMRDPSPFNFAAFFIFNWRHEKCHLTQDLNVFPSIPDPRTKLETIVRLDSAALNREALSGASGFFEANQAILNANTIDSVIRRPGRCGAETRRTPSGIC